MSEYPKLLWRGDEECTVISPEDQAAREKDGFKASSAVTDEPEPDQNGHDADDAKPKRGRR